MLINKELIFFSEEVRQALAQSQPVVALESTIISHGLPYPQNIETALMLEAQCRAHGAVPATIALHQGKVKIGLSALEIEALGAADCNAEKASRRDIGNILVGKRWGSTTVAATMLAAKWAGIRYFATGGIGGVHRGAEHSFDISADLQELAKTAVAVVCAGPKAVLDIPLTIEYLETAGVPVIGYSTQQVPSFYARDSGVQAPISHDNVQRIAEVCQTHWQLGLHGVLICNPIEQRFALDPIVVESVVQQALSAADQANISGKAVTPFLLNYIAIATEGDSISSNVALIKSNVELAAQLAKADAAL